MIVSRRWLEALLQRPLEGRDIADRLARQVAPVDGVVPIHQDLRDVLIARVLEVKQHPNADRLSVCQVDAGGGQPLEVVCGAPNVQAGKTYPFAPVGATLPGGLKLDRRKIRGVESNGMLGSHERSRSAWEQRSSCRRFQRQASSRPCQRRIGALWTALRCGSKTSKAPPAT